MAINLVSLVSQFLTPQLVGSLARTVGVNEAVAQKLVAAAVPVVLGALATTAAAPGGAQKVVDAVSNSDPDLLTKLAGALGGGNVRALSEGANLLGGLLGGSGVSSLAGVLSQFSGATQPASQSALGAVAQAAVGTIGQQDPSNWSDASSIAALFGNQKDAIAAALPPEISRALGATGLLAGLGSLGAAAAQRAGAEASRAASAASSASATATSAANRAQQAAQQAASSSSSGFPMWAIILLIVIVLAAVWWFMTQQQKAPEPAKSGWLPAPVELVLQALPGPRT
jgi:hypothetical protein